MTFTFFTVVVCLAGLVASSSGALYWQMVFCVFGAAAAVELPALGGAVITPAVLFLPFVVARAWSEQFGRRYSRRVPAAGLWLGLVVLYGLVGGYFLPRVFAHEVDILTVDRAGDSLAVALYPLRPVSGNITQNGYALGGLLGFLSVRALLERAGRLEHFRDAVLMLATVNCAAALLNLAEYHLGLPKLLSYVRTAYALFEAYEIEGTGLMRIHGTFSETSAFCAFSLPLFAFTFSLWLNRVRPLYSGSLALLLLMLLLISTSTTAYVGLATYAAVLVFILARRGHARGTIPRVGVLVTGALFAVVVVGSFFVLDTSIGRRLADYFEITVFGKLDSESGTIRSSWNTQAWSNFLDTYGLGVGMGSTRASSFPLVLLSNVGLIGTLMYAAFLNGLFVGNSPPELSPVTEASRQAVLSALLAAAVSCAVFDLGLAFYAFAAAASLPTAGSGKPASGRLIHANS